MTKVYSFLEIKNNPELQQFMSKCKMFPVGEKIIVKVPKPPKRTKGGIELPDEYIDKEQDNTTIGEIVAISRASFDNLEEDDRLILGTKVCFKKYSGIVPQQALNDNFQFRVIGDVDVYCWITDDEYNKILKEKGYIND